MKPVEKKKKINVAEYFYGTLQSFFPGRLIPLMHQNQIVGYQGKNKLNIIHEQAETMCLKG